MYKFAIGDHVSNTSTSEKGLITRRGYNSIYQEGDYTIMWENGKEETVAQDYAEKIFKIILSQQIYKKEFDVAGRRINSFENDIFGDMYQMELPIGKPMDVSIQKTQECIHSWVNYVGFNNSFEFCSKCDKKK